MKGPGADTRTWLFYARVDDDDDAVRWNDEVGWLVDVTVAGGQLDGEGPVACRVGWPYSASGAANSSPVQRGVLVACLLPEADLNGTPVIVGLIPTSGEPVPSSVNGQNIDADFAKATHFLVTEHDVQQEVGERWRTSATQRATLEAPEVRLADEDAGQSYVRGEDYADAADALAEASDDFGQQVLTAFTNLVPPGPPATPVTGAQASAAVVTVTAAYAQLATAVAQFKAARSAYLSTRIKGE